MTKILITRAEPAASRTEFELSRQGHTAVKLPIFKVKDTGKPVPQIGFSGLIFTSRNAVDTLYNRGWSVENSDVPVFCVGENTAKAAAVFGFNDIQTGNGTAKSLAELIAKFGLPANSRLLYPAASDHRFDFGLALKPHDLLIETLEIYEIRKLLPSKLELEKVFEQAAGGAALIYSARSAAHLSDLVKLNGLESSLSSLTCIAISGAATEPVNVFPWRKIVIAPSPDESTMIQLANVVS